MNYHIIYILQAKYDWKTVCLINCTIKYKFMQMGQLTTLKEN